MSTDAAVSLSLRLEAANAAVEAACRATRSVHDLPGEVHAHQKEDRSPVTIADFAAQAVVVMVLERLLPGPLRLVGEERPEVLEGDAGRPLLDAATAAVRTVIRDARPEDVLAAIHRGTAEPDARGFWTLDPVDGTKGFLRRQQYAVALAYLSEGRPTVAALGCPHLPAADDGDVESRDPVGCLASATLAGGATIRPIGAASAGRPLRTGRWSPTTGIVSCESVEPSHSKQDRTAAVLARCGTTAPPLRLDSQCKYAVVARGQAHAYLRLPTKKDYVERIWDHAAGSLIATEAGAVVSDCEGRPLDFRHGRGLERNRGIVAASPELHPLLIAAIAAT